MQKVKIQIHRGQEHARRDKCDSSTSIPEICELQR